MKPQIYNIWIGLVFLTLGLNSQTTDNFSVIASTTSPVSKRVLVTLGSSSTTSTTAVTNKLSYAELSLKEILKLDNMNTENSTTALLNIARQYMDKLQEEADALYNDELAIRLKARQKSPEERKALLEHAAKLALEAEQKMVYASEIRGKINMEHYTSNKNHYNKLSAINRASAKTTLEAESIYFEAERDMRIGSEMREEAYAMPTSSSKLGSMGNADESETSALLKQNKAIQILKQANNQ